MSLPVNRTFMQPDGSLLPTSKKSYVVHALELLVKSADKSQTKSIEEHMHSKHLCHSMNTCLVIDEMGVMQELIAVKTFSSCKQLGDAYIENIDSKAKNYVHVRVIFDKYSTDQSLKESTRERRRAGSVLRDYIVHDDTKIRNGNTKSFLASTKTKDSLTKYLAEKLVAKCKSHVIVASRHSVLANRPDGNLPSVSTQEEADTLIILYAVHAVQSGFDVSI